MFCAARDQRPLGARCARLALLAAWLLGGCGSSSPTPAEPSAEIPERETTAGDEILALVPAGADSILEIDLARLRTNDQVGELFQALTAASDASGKRGETPSLNLFGAGDVIVFVSYGIGEPKPERLVVVRGPNSQTLTGGYRIDERTVAIASGAMQTRLALVAAGREPALSIASPLLRLRALAMPDRAAGAALRAAAHLNFDARVALAKALEVDEVPVSVSVWGDVADDLAIVALISGENALEGDRLAAALGSIRNRMSRFSPIRSLGLGRLVRSAKVENRGPAARMVLLVGPRRLGRVVARLLKRLGVETST